MPPDFSSRAEQDMFAMIRGEDRLLHHPYQSFQPVVDLLNKAAHDPDVLTIKMTLYRAWAGTRQLCRRCSRPLKNGKQVAVLVELKARFDEESNIEWARALESEGVHVVYGLVGLKVHCKIALIVRREQEMAYAVIFTSERAITTRPQRAFIPISRCSPATRILVPTRPICSTF